MSLDFEFRSFLFAMNVVMLSCLSPTVAIAMGERPVGQTGAKVSFQEKQCEKKGWQSVTLEVGGAQRRVLWKGPKGAWAQGAILVLHGGGGHHFQFCVANARIVEPQVRFTELAIAEGFAVFLLESTDHVTDNKGRLCGKVWDDEVRDRPNLDLPFIETIIRTVIPDVRPPNSRGNIFMTGLSSGAFMTVRAATRFGHLITAFAPVSGSDPYGWHRICEKDMTQRTTVHGSGFDNETGKQISEPDACYATDYPQEKPWEGTDVSSKPVFRMFHHKYDGIVDLSCSQKAATLLRRQGYPEVPAYHLTGNKRRSLYNHLWLDDYNRPLLAFFSDHVRVKE